MCVLHMCVLHMHVGVCLCLCTQCLREEALNDSIHGERQNQTESEMLLLPPFRVRGDKEADWGVPESGGEIQV